MKYLLFVLIAAFIFLNIVFGAWTVLHKDILFHTDLARDFLLFEDIVKNKPITLIGPRSGGISGLFHGPLWLYVNIPAFIIGKGNPVVVGWFWVFLNLIYLGLIYIIGTKLFDEKVGVMSLLLASVTSAGAVSGLFNPFGAVMIAPLYFYFLYLYIRHKKIIHLVFGLFLLGLIIQFQMAFGIPILFLTFLYIGYKSLKERQIQRMFSFLILIIPLSTHILFELRHQFLETKSFIHYLSSGTHQNVANTLHIIFARLKGFSIDSLTMIVGDKWWLLLPFFIAFLVAFAKILGSKISKEKIIYILFIYLYAGFWLLTLLYKGVVWGYYYWPFLPLIIIVFASFYKHINRKLFYILFLVILLFNFIQNVRGVQNSRKFSGKDGSSWKFNYLMAQTIFKGAPSEFGYYIFTPDLFGYSPRYAMNYTQDQNKDKKAFPFIKKNITYLIIAPPPKDRPFLDGVWWKTHQVKIDSQPVFVQRYANGFRIEKYELTDEDVKIGSDPNLIQTLFFR